LLSNRTRSLRRLRRLAQVALQCLLREEASRVPFLRPRGSSSLANPEAQRAAVRRSTSAFSSISATKARAVNCPAPGIVISRLRRCEQGHVESRKEDKVQFPHDGEHRLPQKRPQPTTQSDQNENGVADDNPKSGIINMAPSMRNRLSATRGKRQLALERFDRVSGRQRDRLHQTDRSF
jgi:hypothetical protein